MLDTIVTTYLDTFVNMFGERLRLQLDSENLSPSQFADAIGVNRSAVSHLLNNRNNPGYDFLNKVYEHFPEWDMDWLLFNQTKKEKGPKRAKPQPSVEEKKRAETKEAPNRTPQAYEQGDLFNNYESHQTERNLPQPNVRKTVTKTILIYSDGTFEIYQNNFR